MVYRGVCVCLCVCYIAVKPTAVYIRGAKLRWAQSGRSLGAVTDDKTDVFNY